MSELFIGGDPRFLSGCLKGCSANDYTSAPSVITKATPQSRLATTEALGALPDGQGLPEAVSRLGVEVHYGKAGYHHRPRLNLFLREGEWPSCGVELETEEREDVPLRELATALRSNWFHFESDSSLGTGSTDGYELITEPLPPRCYRNPRLWAGLQNILSPWVRSWEFRQTGLHVHVGMTQFEELAELSPYLVDLHDRRYFGKVLSAYLYFNVVPRTFTDKVFLRKPGEYCHAPEQPKGFMPWREGTTGHDVLRNVLFAVMSYEAASGNYTRSNVPRTVVGYPRATSAASAMGADRAGAARGTSSLRYIGHGCSFSGHSCEINVQNEHTLEFRRGKGTLNGVSILRMVEFCTLLVRYAAKLVRSPDDPVGPAEIYRYIAENTTSEALKSLAEAELKGV